MRPLWKDIALAAVLGILFPWLILDFGIALQTGNSEQLGELRPVETVVSEGGTPAIMTLRNGEERVSMKLETYLVGVVCGEMPASFEEEALKAQAVVARTYTLKAMTNGGKHGDGSLCADPGCCQAYVSEQKYLDGGGTTEDLKKIQAAVAETTSMVLTYEGELIEATYFSCSGGYTEDAIAVWGSDYPYLRAKESLGEEAAAYYEDTAFFTRQKLEQALDITLGEDPRNWIGYTTYTAGGGINTIVIGGKEFPGTQIRKLLDLRSTAFTWSSRDGGIEILTRGYGHRVGMSQYGADAMAAKGAGFEEILSYYYTGTELISWAEN